jgi:ABC-type bacteriocin/lantibiotic exporter with double-glycine peptidase domain
MQKDKLARRDFVLQQDQSDCGVACLASIIKFHKGDSSLEYLRKLSGTSKQGTTLLGLMQAAQQLGFEAEGLEAEGVYNLKELNEPAILHVVLENKLQHYVIYYPSAKLDILSIGDPAKGIIQMNKDELNSIWQSKALLKLTPNASFKKSDVQQSKKKLWIIKLIRDDFPILLVSLVLGIAFSVLSITTAIFSQKLIDDILPKENIQKFWLSLVLVTLLMLARSGIGYIRSFFMGQQAMAFNNRIIQYFYNTLLVLPKSFFDTRKIGELIARMNDTRRIQSALAVISGGIVIDLLVVIISLGFVFSYASSIGFILLGALPVYYWMLVRFNKPIINFQKEVMVGNALAESNFIDTMQGVADIKLMNKHLFFERLNSLVYGDFQKRIFALNKVQYKFGFVSEVTGVLLIIAVFGIASWLVLTKKLKLGEMVALISIAGNVVPSVNRLVVSNIQVQEALVAFDRMFEFTSMEKEDVVNESAIQSEENSIEFQSIELRNVSFRFPGRKQILNNASLQVNKGEMIALLGQSGGGKSTLIQIVQKFYQPESGYILVGNNELQTLKTSIWRDQLGAVPQDIKIFNGSLLYNITLSDKPEDFQLAHEFCERAGLSTYFNDFPQGYLTLLGEEGINISGGQKQIVAITRALFRKPKLLLLDEATSAMDRNTENFVLTLLQKEKEKMAILIVTHRIKAAKCCDRIYILENGSISSSGSPDQLLETKNIYSNYFNDLIS